MTNNIDGFMAIMRTAKFLRWPEKHGVWDLNVDMECLMGEWSNTMPEQFGWMIRDMGTHMFNPVDVARVIPPTKVEKIFGVEPDAETGKQKSFCFWWNGQQLFEVTAEQLEEHLLEAFIEINDVYGEEDAYTDVTRRLSSDMLDNHLTFPVLPDIDFDHPNDDWFEAMTRPLTDEEQDLVDRLWLYEEIDEVG